MGKLAGTLLVLVFAVTLTALAIQPGDLLPQISVPVMWFGCGGLIAKMWQ